jgi:hypothetical protein
MARCIFSFAIFLLISALGVCKTPCQVVEETAAFFDNSKSMWRNSETLQILKCAANNFEMAIVQKKSKKELDRKSLEKPEPGERWFFDGLTCNEPAKNSKPLLYRNKIVLGVGLKIRKAWAPDFKSKKIIKLDANKLICYEDEP